MQIDAGGMVVWTDDPVVQALARHCARLRDELVEREHHEVARYRTLRRDVTQIKRAVVARANS